MRTKPSTWIVAALAGITSIPATYALLRAYEVVFKTEPTPAKIVWSPHIAMFWRLAIGGYVAGMVASLVFLAARHDLPRTVRGLSIGVLVAGAMCAIQGLFMP